MCQTCGCELCNECYLDFCRSSFAAIDGVEQSSLRCTSITPKSRHAREDFLPTTRFHPSEIQPTIEQMKRVLDLGAPSLDYAVSDTKATAPASAFVAEMPPAPHTRRSTTANTKSAPYHHHRTRLLLADELSESTFSAQWKLGDPIVVENFKALAWSAEFFIRNYGEQECTIVNCTNKEQKTQKVHDFFATFGKYTRNRGGPWKLKVS
jgi:hypothetical protein